MLRCPVHQGCTSTDQISVFALLVFLWAPVTPRSFLHLYERLLQLSFFLLAVSSSRPRLQTAWRSQIWPQRCRINAKSTPKPGEEPNQNGQKMRRDGVKCRAKNFGGAYKCAGSIQIGEFCRLVKFQPKMPVKSQVTAISWQGPFWPGKSRHLLKIPEF